MTSGVAMSGWNRFKERAGISLALGVCRVARFLARRTAAGSALRGARLLALALGGLRLRRVSRERAERLFDLARARLKPAPSCWEESLSRAAWLSALGHPAAVAVGVRKSAAGIEAHAWNAPVGASANAPERDAWTPLFKAPLA